MACGPAIELVPIVFGHTEIVRDHHRRQRLEQLGDDVAAAVGAQPLDALDDELAHLGLHRLDLPRGETARHQFAKLGVHRRILHDERRIILQSNHFQVAIVDGQSLRRGERLVVAGRRPDVGVPGQHVVVVLRGVSGHDVVHRVVVAQRAVHRPGIRPGVGVGELEPDRCVVRHNRSHVLFVRQQPQYVNHLSAERAASSTSAAERAPSSTLEQTPTQARSLRRGSGCPTGRVPA